MFTRPLLRFLVEPLHVILELLAVDAPHAAAPDLDRRQLSGADERIHLRHADAQIDGYVVERQKARLDLDLPVWRARRVLGHLLTIAAVGVGYLYLASFAAVWRKRARGVTRWT